MTAGRDFGVPWENALEWKPTKSERAIRKVKPIRVFLMGNVL
jgi:hypothetical protein